MIINFNNIVIPVTMFFSLFSTLFFLTTFVENNQNCNEKRKRKKYPRISVIIPAYNEGKNIIRTIKSVLKVDYPQKKLEIIFVDDGSKDDTLKQAKKIKNRLLRVFSKKHGGKAKAVNFGIKKSKGEIVMILDADTFPTKDCFKNIVSCFDNPKVMAALPLIKIWQPKSMLEKFQAIEYTITAIIKKTFSFMGSMNCAPAGALIRKKFLEKHGLFETDTLTEDFEMGMRIQSKNYQVIQSLESKVYTIPPKRVKKLIRQRVRWSFGTLENIRKYKHMLNPRYGDLGVFFLPSTLFSIGLISFIFLYFLVRFILDIIHNIYLNSLIQFDILPLLKLDLALRLNNFLTDEKSLLIMFTILTALLLYEIARRNINEKFRLSYVFYLLIYGWTLGVSQIIALFYFIIGKKPGW
jgi:cellulose synthase/poly-beta-1,6-N-acetylglucosamine synthase-like glycosyltransferase